MAGQRVSPGSVHGRTARITEELVVSENTIRTHMRRLYAKLNVHKKQEPLDLPESVKANEIQAVRPVDADGRGRTMDAARQMWSADTDDGCGPKDAARRVFGGRALLAGRFYELA